MADEAPKEEVPEEPTVDAEGAEEAPSAEAEVDPVAVVEAERDQYKNALQLLQADFENYRKRTTKQQGEFAERANEHFAAKLLPVLDTLDMARAHEPDGTVQQVAAALLEVLNKEGLERMVVVDAPFDPNEHEAVAHDEGDSDEGTKVSEEFRAGYRWKGRTLRPAMVKTIG